MFFSSEVGKMLSNMCAPQGTSEHLPSRGSHDEYWGAAPAPCGTQQTEHQYGFHKVHVVTIILIPDILLPLSYIFHAVHGNVFFHSIMEIFVLMLLSQLSSRPVTTVPFLLWRWKEDVFRKLLFVFFDKYFFFFSFSFL